MNDSKFGEVVLALIFPAIVVMVCSLAVNNCMNSNRDDCIRSGGKFYNRMCHMDGE